jgi:excisionase family DNA binding protein
MKKNVDNNEKLLTISEVSKILRVDPTTTRRWIKSGALDAVMLPHVGRRQAYRVMKATVDALLNEPAVRRVPNHH